MEDILDPNEQIIWSGKPIKKAFLLSSLWGIPVGLFFLALTTVFLMTGTPFFSSPAIITIPLAIGLFIVPPIWQKRKTSHAEYMITNQRLIIKSGITKEDVWFEDLDNIKDVIVKIGLFDKLLGIGKLFPITAAYPSEPKGISYTQGGMNRPVKVFNIVEQKYEKITEMEHYRMFLSVPCLTALSEPFVVQKLLKEAIFGTGTNFVSCNTAMLDTT